MEFICVPSALRDLVETQVRAGIVGGSRLLAHSYPRRVTWLALRFRCLRCSCFQQRWPQQHVVPVLLARHPGLCRRRASEGTPAAVRSDPEDGESLGCSGQGAWPQFSSSWPDYWGGDLRCFSCGVGII